MNDLEKLYKLIWMSRPLMQAAEAVVERGLDGTGLTVRARAVLEVLYAKDKATVPDIAEKLEIKRQYVQVMVNETLAEGFTMKRENPRHKRSSIIALTDIGRAVIEGVIRREMTVVSSISAGLKATDVDAALEVVMTLTEKLKSEQGSN